MSRWEDLVKASDILGRPIFRFDDETRRSDQPLFYIPDGPQSFVFDFRTLGRTTSTSGAYSLPVPPAAAQLPEPPLLLDPPTPPKAEPIAPTPPVPAPRSSIPDNAAIPGLRSSPASKDEIVEEYLGPDVPDPPGPAGPPGAPGVEREIRGMIHQLLNKLRGLPPSSDRLEKGTFHIERAIELLRFGRYGQAQIELNRAARLIAEPDAAQR